MCGERVQCDKGPRSWLVVQAHQLILILHFFSAVPATLVQSTRSCPGDVHPPAACLVSLDMHLCKMLHHVKRSCAQLQGAVHAGAPAGAISHLCGRGGRDAVAP